jgi:hypothetical protein
MSKFLFGAAIAISTLYGFAAFGQDFQSTWDKEGTTSKSTVSGGPSKQALCGYEWRMAKIANPGMAKDRAAWVNYMHEHCGMKGKTRNDDALKGYIGEHPDWRGEVDDIGNATKIAKGRKKFFDDCEANCG